MYTDDLKISSSRYTKANKALFEAVMENSKSSESKRDDSLSTLPYQKDAEMVMENVMASKAVRDRFNSFSETVRSSLVTEALYKIYKECVTDEIKADRANVSIMRAIVNQYVYENGYTEILSNMKTASGILSEMSNVVEKNIKSIIESVDKDNPNTFAITSAMRDEFFNQLDYSDTDAISNAIKAKVADSIDDFVTANTKDHEDITAALQQAQEKIADVPAEDVELKESYELKAKRKITEIRNAPKSVFHAMVRSLCESVMKNPETHKEFMTEDNHLDMDKITSRVSIMYTFMEMLDSTRIEKIDEAFIEGVIKDLAN